MRIIDTFVRNQAIDRLHNKPALSRAEQEHLRYLLAEEAISLRVSNSLLRNELQRLNQLLGSNMH